MSQTAGSGTAPSRNADGGQLPPDTSRSLPIALLRAREAVMTNFRPMLASHGVTEQQWRVMRVLSETGKLDASDLAARANILAPSLTRILKALEDCGYVLRERDGNDGRRSWITLSDNGHRFIARVAPQSRAIYAEMEARFGPQRISDMVDLLIELTETVRRD